MPVEFSLDRSSPVPLYFQMSEQLEAAIADGTLRPGDRIDTEIDIAERYGLSRPTVRQAIQELVNKGLLVRRRGVGTQVVHAQVRRQLGLTSLFDDLSRGEHRPSTEVLDCSEVPADSTVSAALQVAPDSLVLHLTRVRFQGKEPLALMQNWIPCHLLPPNPDAFRRSGLYELLRAAGVHLHIAHQRIGARAASAEEARLLDVRKGSPLLTMTRTAFDNSGVPVEHGTHAYRADAYTFETTLMDR